MNNYWIMRTDRRTDEIRKFIWQELQQGRLRQDWAWKDEQSLTVLDSISNTDMTDEQKESWRGNRRMLQSHGDGIKPGDIILVPHVPHNGVWSIVRRLDAPYQFDRTNPFEDYGHTLAVEHLSTTRPVSFHEEAVSAHLRSTMRNPKRMWNIGRLSAEVERLISALQNNHSSENVYNRIPHFFNQVELAAWEALQQHFKGAEFERPCRLLLGALYGEENVEKTAGRNENGADAICNFTDPMGIASRVTVQIKMWDWNADSDHPLQQLRRAFQEYEGVTAGVVMTTAEGTTPTFEHKRQELETELRIPIRVVARKQLIRLFMTHLPSLLQE